MNQTIIEKLNALEAQGDKELEQAIRDAKSMEEVIELLKAKGIKVTAEELADIVENSGSDELGEADLENVAGGSWASIGYQVGRGYRDGKLGTYRGGGIYYTIGYICGRWKR